MKTSNYTRESKTTVVNSLFSKGSAIVCGLAMITLTVNAQTLWEKYSSYAQTTLTLTDQHSGPNMNEFESTLEAASEKATFVADIEQEAELKIEDWMTDESNFVSTFSISETETEDALEIEEWMIDAKNFSSFSFETSNDLEKPLELEPWMTDESNFKPKEIGNDLEPSLQVESWMIENKNFETNFQLNEYLENESLELEAWMTNNQFWGF